MTLPNGQPGQPEPNEGIDLLENPAIAQALQGMEERSAGLESQVMSEQELLAKEKALQPDAMSNMIGKVIGAALGAAIGGAVDGKRGALIGVGGASTQLLSQAEKEEELIAKQIERIRKRNEKQKDAVSESKEEILKTRLGLTKEGFKMTVRERSKQLDRASREKAAVLSRTPQHPYTEDDTARIELTRQVLSDLERVRAQLDTVSDGDWVDFVKDSLDPENPASFVIADLQTLAIAEASSKQKGTLTERDVQPFRAKAGLKAFKNKASLIKAVDKLLVDGSQDLVGFSSAAMKRNLNPTAFVTDLRQQAVNRMVRMLPTAKNPDTGQTLVLRYGKWVPIESLLDARQAKETE